MSGWGTAIDSEAASESLALATPTHAGSNCTPFGGGEGPDVKHERLVTSERLLFGKVHSFSQLTGLPGQDDRRSERMMATTTMMTSAG